MPGFDPNQPRDELGRWTVGGRAKVTGQVRNQGKVGTIREIDPKQMYVTLEDSSGKAMGIYHVSDVEMWDEGKVNETISAARKAAGVHAENDVKKFGIREFKGHTTQTGASKKYPTIGKEEVPAYQKEFGRRGWKVHTPKSYGLYTQYFWDQGGMVLEKDDILVVADPFKDDLMKIWYTRRRKNPIHVPYD